MTEHDRLAATEDDRPAATEADRPAATGADAATVRFRLRLGGRPVELGLEVPAERARVEDLLPAFQAVAGEIVAAAAAEQLDAHGGSISCRAGCGACCRQPVPIAPSEARHLMRLVAALPRDRRRTIRARFEAARNRLDDAGLLDRVRAMDRLEDVDDRLALGLEYFALGIPCPFLEEESCGIHPDRPLACREYLVTSPAQACATPSAETVDVVPMPARPSVALFHLDAGGGPAEPRSGVLVLAPEQAATPDAAPPVTGTGPELLERFLRSLTGRDASTAQGR